MEDYKPTSADAVRFWGKVDKSGECWTWKASKTWAGYGRFRLPRKTLSAHRFSYLLEHGELPDSLVVDHTCRTRDCVRPDHLRMVTHEQNAENKALLSRTARSGVRGVSWNKTNGKWQSRVGHRNKLYFGGHFDTIEEAAEASRALRLKLHTANEVDRDAG